MAFESGKATHGGGGDQPSPRDDAIRLLARREYSRHEIESRLLAKGHAHENVAACLDALAEQGLQSDARFAEHFVRSRIQRGQGPRKVRAELDQRGVARETVNQALEEAEVDWYQLAAETLARRFSDPGEAPKQRAKRERFLAGRGFDFDQLKHALAHAWDPHEVD
ncbi:MULTISPECIES: regulatory protein RecX [Halomonadaceae]|uniref:regulatory protein RecX n=1 Tax=Halomonadaceae TaxID=28256 RepID=UPI0015828953|nr:MULTISPECIES: regulatory protein RecX [Halomonas]MDI4637226.1 recombination regulator RecX [Halomonas sp. BMC7]NUJ58394.1 regulatory protein RecX [Halomonas taeanensis]|tara:strand:- start:36546 stop:37043 length:498 start_codon:yes stop_codon:yes gene_type:complete